MLAAEPVQRWRVYVCAFATGERRAWLVLDAGGAPVTSRARVREAVSIAALCEIAGEAAGDQPPRLASPAYLDAAGTADVVAGALAAVDSLAQDVERAYKVELELT